MMIKKYISPIGELVLVVRNGALVEVRLDGEWIDEEAGDDGDGKVMEEISEWLDGYFSGKKMGIDRLRLRPEGTEFQKEIWGVLRRIKYGEIMSYGEIAREIAEGRGLRKMSAQAVGQAVGKNPIPIIVPCHRVVGKDGKMTGYSGGMEKKIWLLRHERMLEI